MALKCVFYSEFDNVAGPKIFYQSPENFISPETFDAISDYIITKPQVCSKLITCTAFGYTFMGYPQCIEGDHFARNALLFNVVFVFNPRTNIIPFKPVVKKLAFVLRSLETEIGFLSKEAKSQLKDILPKIHHDLNITGQSVIEIDDANTINLRVFHGSREPVAPVQAHHVPVWIRQIPKDMTENWDLTILHILPYINGINYVKKIAVLSDVDIGLVKKAVEHLLFYQCVKLLDIFQYTNMYAIVGNTKPSSCFSRADTATPSLPSSPMASPGAFVSPGTAQNQQSPTSNNSSSSPQTPSLLTSSLINVQGKTSGRKETNTLHQNTDNMFNQTDSSYQQNINSRNSQNPRTSNSNSMLHRLFFDSDTQQECRNYVLRRVRIESLNQNLNEKDTERDTESEPLNRSRSRYRPHSQHRLNEGDESLASINDSSTDEFSGPLSSSAASSSAYDGDINNSGGHSLDSSMFGSHNPIQSASPYGIPHRGINEGSSSQRNNNNHNNHNINHNYYYNGKNMNSSVNTPIANNAFLPDTNDYSMDEIRNDEQNTKVFDDLPFTDAAENITFRDILRIYCSMQPGVRLYQILSATDEAIDHRALITYGIVKGFLRRVHEYPMLIDQFGMAEPGEPLPEGEGEVGSGLSDDLKLLLDGTHCEDEICCLLDMPREQLMQLIQDRSDVAIISK